MNSSKFLTAKRFSPIQLEASAIEYLDRNANAAFKLDADNRVEMVRFEEGLPAASVLSKINKLTAIKAVLFENRMRTDKSAFGKAHAESITHSPLIDAILINCRAVSEDGIKQLANLELICLRLFECQLTDAHLTYIETIQTLKMLTIAGNPKTTFRKIYSTAQALSLEELVVDRQMLRGNSESGLQSTIKDANLVVM